MVVCDTLASSQCNTRSQQGAERGTGESRCAITTPTPPHTPTAETRHTFVTTMLDAGVDLRDVQIATRHADPRTTMRYDRARTNLDRHPNYVLAAFMASGT
jgi:integrase/recombinase XerD